MSARAWRVRRRARACNARSEFGVCHRKRGHRPEEHASYIGGGRPFGRYSGGGPEVWFVFGHAVSPAYRIAKVR